MTTISSSLPTSAYTYTSPTGSAGSGTTPVATTTNPSLPGTAVTLSTEAGVIATLGANQDTGVTTYNAAGLLNSFVQATNPSQATPQTTNSVPATNPLLSTSQTASSNDTLDQAVINSLSSTSTNTDASSGISGLSSVYNANGLLQTSTSTDVTSNWVTLLKQDPGLAGNAIADSMNQGIIGTLSAFA